MAFVNRSYRETGVRNLSTSETIGPGKYELLQKRKVAISYAPFASSSERLQPTITKQVTPGPADYRFQKRSQSASVSSPTFVSKVPRFLESTQKMNSTASSPGPTSYNLKNSWLKGQAHPRKQKQAKSKVSWVKVSAAPSIPAPAQSYGYEQTKNGELILQKPPNRGYKGEKGDTVGVGQYTPHKAFGSQSSKIDFGSSKVKRLEDVRDPGYNVGPGNYFHSQPDAEIKKKKENMIFKSKTARLPKTHQADVPGPGKYSQTGVFSKTQLDVPKEFQFFGSSSPKSSGLFDMKGFSPGPGAYAQAVISADKEDRDMKGGFSSKQVRWEVKKKNKAPGPGSYLSQNNTSEELHKKVFGRNTSFGQTTKRFVANKDSFKENPGPGRYTEKKLVQPIKSNSVFMSAKARFKNYQQDSMPAPGQYETFPEDLIRDPQRSSAAFAMESRERSNKRNYKHGTQQLQNLGPTSYEPEKVGRRAPRTSAFKSQVQRTGYDNNTELPGPGAYETQSHLISRSHNITIGQ